MAFIFSGIKSFLGYQENEFEKLALDGKLFRIN